MTLEQEEKPRTSLFNQILAHAQAEGRNVAFEAVDHLKDRDDIREFFRGYTQWLGHVNEEGEENPLQIAAININYIFQLGYSPQTAELWHSAIEGLKPR